MSEFAELGGEPGLNFVQYLEPSRFPGQSSHAPLAELAGASGRTLPADFTAAKSTGMEVGIRTEVHDD
jgi:hypothetical protein